MSAVHVACSIESSAKQLYANYVVVFSVAHSLCIAFCDVLITTLRIVGLNVSSFSFVRFELIENPCAKSVWQQPHSLIHLRPLEVFSGGFCSAQVFCSSVGVVDPVARVDFFISSHSFVPHSLCLILCLCPSHCRRWPTFLSCIHSIIIFTLCLPLIYV